jgi:hypothetical protein
MRYPPDISDNAMNIRFANVLHVRIVHREGLVHVFDEILTRCINSSRSRGCLRAREGRARTLWVPNVCRSLRVDAGARQQPGQPRPRSPGRAPTAVWWPAQQEQRHLMAQDEGSGVLGPVGPGEQSEQSEPAEHAEHRHVDET